MAPSQGRLLMVAFTAAAGCLGESLIYDPPGGRTLSVCTCNKCGSSALLCAIRSAIFAHEGIIKRPHMRCHGHDRWLRVPHVVNYTWQEPEADFAHADLRVHIVRDPVDRYVSAFHGKVACCPGVHDRACINGVNRVESLAPWLTEARIPRKRMPKCLDFTQYVDALERAFATDASRRSIDPHFMPQDVVCTARSNVPTLRGTLSGVAPALEALRWPGLAGSTIAPPRPGQPDRGIIRVQEQHVGESHHTDGPAPPRPTRAGATYNLSAPMYRQRLRTLCALSAREYEYLQMPPRPECLLAY